MMLRFVLLGATLAALAACSDEPEPVTIDLRVHPARLDDAPEQPPPAGWQRVAFAGSERASAATYLVADESLLSGWNMTALRIAEQPGDTRAVSFRLNAAARERLAEFTADEANLKMPLVLRVDGRVADVSPLLRPPGDRMTLFGLTPEEASRLEAWIEVR